MHLPVHFRTPWRYPSVWPYHHLCYSTAFFLSVCSLMVEGTHLFFTSTKRHDSLGACAIRNTGLALFLNHFQSAHSKKNVLDNLFSPLFPRYGVDLILIFALSIFQPIYPCIHSLLLSLKCGLGSVEHQTLYRGTENTKMSGPSLCHPML